MRKLLLLSFVLVASLSLAACGASKSDAPAKAVENYLNALVAKDANRLPTLVCGAWEEDALVELDFVQVARIALEAHQQTAKRCVTVCECFLRTHNVSDIQSCATTCLLNSLYHKRHAALLHCQTILLFARFAFENFAVHDIVVFVLVGN